MGRERIATIYAGLGIGGSGFGRGLGESGFGRGLGGSGFGRGLGGSGFGGGLGGSGFGRGLEGFGGFLLHHLLVITFHLNSILAARRQVA